MVTDHIFESPAIKETLSIARRFAKSKAPVLLSGETGTGKEIFAEFIHANSLIYDQPIVYVNCASLTKELFESEMFGAVKGAYTGCGADRAGLIGKAEGGTLFLDELSEMPIETQPKLLRLLQGGDYRRVGSAETRTACVRVLASTNMTPDECLKCGKLRRDLYYRISTVTLHIPALRNRLEDVQPLALHFLKSISASENLSVPSVALEVLEILKGYAWPGNVRQLYSEMYHARLMADDVILPEHLGACLSQKGDSENPLKLLELGEKSLILSALRSCNWNKSLSAKKLGMGRQTLYNKMKLFELEEIKEQAGP